MTKKQWEEREENYPTPEGYKSIYLEDTKEEIEARNEKLRLKVIEDIEKSKEKKIKDEIFRKEMLIIKFNSAEKMAWDLNKDIDSLNGFIKRDIERLGEDSIIIKSYYDEINDLKTIGRIRYSFFK